MTKGGYKQLYWLTHLGWLTIGEGRKREDSTGVVLHTHHCSGGHHREIPACQSVYSIAFTGSLATRLSHLQLSSLAVLRLEGVRASLFTL